MAPSKLVSDNFISTQTVHCQAAHDVHPVNLPTARREPRLLPHGGIHMRPLHPKSPTADPVLTIAFCYSLVDFWITWETHLPVIPKPLLPNTSHLYLCPFEEDLLQHLENIQQIAQKNSAKLEIAELYQVATSRFDIPIGLVTTFHGNFHWSNVTSIVYLHQYKTYNTYMTSHVLQYIFKSRHHPSLKNMTSPDLLQLSLTNPLKSCSIIL